MKSSRSSKVSSASLISGSDRPAPSMTRTRVAGDASSRATSTKSLPPARYMGRAAVSCHIDSPRGFMGSVIIC